MINARITSWKKTLGQQGDGSVVLGDELVGVEIPCELIAPSAYARSTARAEGVELVWTIRVAIAALMPIDTALIENGDRLTIARLRRAAPAEAFGVVMVREMGDVVEVGLGVRTDGAAE